MNGMWSYLEIDQDGHCKVKKLLYPNQLSEHGARLSKGP